MHARRGALQLLNKFMETMRSKDWSPLSDARLRRSDRATRRLRSLSRASRVSANHVARSVIMAVYHKHEYLPSCTHCARQINCIRPPRVLACNLAGESILIYENCSSFLVTVPIARCVLELLFLLRRILSFVTTRFLFLPRTFP